MIGRFFLVVLAGLVAFAGTAGAAERKPNIIYILLDDAGWGDLGSYGQKKLKTPHMDQLAKEGMRFTDHYSGSTVCAPSRCVLMTGLHTGHAAIRGNKGVGYSEGVSEGDFALPDDAVTVAELLKQAGYATGCFGKWGIGGIGDALKQGFDRFYGYYSQSFAHDFYPRWLWDNNKKVMLNREHYSHTLIFDQALAFIREHKDAPFFCYLPVTIPHAAMQAPPEYHERFCKEYSEFNNKIGRYGGDNRKTEVKNPIAGFAAMMTKMDDDVGSLMALLKELEIDGETIVMLSSDNGTHKEGGHDPLFWNSAGPFTGGKRSLYEGGVRCPFIVRWPGVVKAGTVTDLISAHWDVLPTLCEVAGVSVPKKIDGISMLPTLVGRGKQERHKYLYWEFYEKGGRRAVRIGTWKAVQNDWGEDSPGAIELYDLSKDVAERNDLARKYPEIVERIERIFKEAHTPDPNWEYKGVGDGKKKKNDDKKKKK